MLGFLWEGSKMEGFYLGGSAKHLSNWFRDGKILEAWHVIGSWRILIWYDFLFLFNVKGRDFWYFGYRSCYEVMD